MRSIAYLLVVLGAMVPPPSVRSFTPFPVKALHTTLETAVAALYSTSTPEVPDYTGKTIYQRTFYRLTPGSTVSHPNAIVIEERLRFRPDPQNAEYILPHGPRTLILRQGTHEDRITEELYRVNLGTKPHSGPGTLDTAIATMLYLASNPELVQGDVLELSCEDGAASLIGAIGARFVLDPNIQKRSEDDDMQLFTVPKHQNIFPKRMHHLTMADEGESALGAAYDIVKGFSNGEVSLKDIRWSTRIPGRRYDHYYRLIVGSDIDFTYPEAKELARTVANYLLPSNEFSVASIKDAEGSSVGAFGAIGMDMVESRTGPTVDHERLVNPKVPASFVHVCPDTRESTSYLRQFLEKGFKMTVNTGYLKMERLQFVLQALPEDSPESEIEDMDLELKDETFRTYQSLVAVHNPNYAGEGAGEYFFPLETGEYDGGARSTYLEPEEGGSPW